MPIKPVVSLAALPLEVDSITTVSLSISPVRVAQTFTDLSSSPTIIMSGKEKIASKKNDQLSAVIRFMSTNQR